MNKFDNTNDTQSYIVPYEQNINSPEGAKYNNIFKT